MKKTIFSILVCALFACNFVLNADEAAINMQYKGNQHTHNEYYLPADAPEVYYDSDEMEIIIIADGFASYYNVDIFSVADTTPILWAVVNGTYGDGDASRRF